MARLIRKILLILLIPLSLLSLLFVIGVTLIYQKQGKLVQQALEKYNDKIPGRLTLEYSKVSPFENFPYISIDLHGLRVFESKLDTIPILELMDVYVGFDILKLVKGDFEVAKIKLADGHIDLVMHSDTTYNLLNAMMIPDSVDEPKEEAQAFALELKELTMRDLRLSKISEMDTSSFEVYIKRLNTGIRKTETDIFAKLKGDILLSVRLNELDLAKEKAIYFQTELDYVKAEQLVKISPSELFVQGVNFSFSGTADLDNDMELDLRIRGEKEDFSLFFALMPDELDEFVQRYRNAGNIYFEALIKGKSANAHIPFIEAKFGCRNGFFQNTNVNRTLDQLSFVGYYTNGAEGTLKSSEFRLLDFNAVPEQGVVKANLILRDFLDPYVDLKVYTDFDLQFLADFFQLSSLENLKGKVLLDVNYDELVDISKPETVLEGVQQGIDSKLRIRDLQFVIPGYPYPVDDINLTATMVDGRLQLDTFRMRIGESDLRLSGFVTDFPALLHKQQKEIQMGLQIRSELIDLLALTGFDSTVITPIEEQIEQLRTSFVFKGIAKDFAEFEYLPKGEFVLDDFYMSMRNYPHTFHDFDLHLLIAEQDMTVKKWRGEVDDSDFDLQIKLYNYPKWFRDTTDGQSRIEFVLNSEHLHPGDLLSYKGVNYVPKEYAEEDIRKLRLIGSLDLNYHKGSLKYYDFQIDDAKALLTLHPLKLEGIKGRIHGEDGIINTEGLSLRMGQSDINLGLTYHYAEELKSKQNVISIRSAKLDFDELSNYEKALAQAEDSLEVHAEAFNVFDLPFSNTLLSLSIGKLKYHKVWIENLESRLRMTEDHFVHIDQLQMDMAGGHIDLTGYLNGNDPQKIYFAPTLKVTNLDLNQLLIKAENFGQEYLVNENIKGLVTGEVKGMIRLYPDLFPILNESDLKMDIMIKNGVLVNYGPMKLLGDYFRDRNLNYVRFDTLRNTFTLKDNVLIIPAMTINSSLGFIELSGTQSMDMSMNYFIRIPWSVVTNAGVQRLFGGKNKAEVPDNQIDEIIMRDTGRRVRFLNIQISGTPDDYRIGLGRDRTVAKQH
jgi:hypothetical protein